MSSEIDRAQRELSRRPIDPLVRKAVISGLAIVKAALPHVDTSAIGEPTINLYVRAFSEMRADPDEIELAFYNVTIRQNPVLKFWPAPAEVIEQFALIAKGKPFIEDPVFVIEKGVACLASRKRCEELGVEFFEEDPIWKGRAAELRAKAVEKGDLDPMEFSGKAMPKAEPTAADQIISQREKAEWLKDQKAKLAKTSNPD